MINCNYLSYCNCVLHTHTLTHIYTHCCQLIDICMWRPSLSCNLSFPLSVCLICCITFISSRSFSLYVSVSLSLSPSYPADFWQPEHGPPSSQQGPINTKLMSHFGGEWGFGVCGEHSGCFNNKMYSCAFYDPLHIERTLGKSGLLLWVFLYWSLNCQCSQNVRGGFKTGLFQYYWSYF